MNNELIDAIVDVYLKSVEESMVNLAEGEKAAFGCMSVEFLKEPPVPSQKDVCADCGAEVWISDNMRHIAYDERTVILCLRCVKESIEKQEVTDPSQED